MAAATLFSKESVRDLVLLTNIDEQSILNTLKNRHHSHEIYTYIGSVLISVNPFQSLSIYGEKYLRKFPGRYMYELPPHIYAIAEETIVALRNDQENQCMIISGESGSGKTEASKLLIQYMAAVSGNSDDIMHVKDRLLLSNPVLEAFGNAKTLRNNNSSRFGKYMEVAFSFNSDPIGGTIRNFLLEKSRVVSPSLNERNFHIFYQVTRGMSKQDREQYFIREPEFFRYLNKSECYEVKGSNDDEELASTLAGLQALQISEKTTSEILSTVAAVLWIGQIEIVSSTNGDGAAISDREPLSVVSQLLGCSEKHLEEGLLFKSIQTRSETIKTSNTVENAEFTRDALAKTIYSRLFEWVVAHVNAAIDPALLSGRGNNVVATIGILDIYGFEIFETNSFEQFCINYANEKLQRVFITRTLEAEQAEYDAEDIKWNHIDYFNNKIVCDLIEKKPYGIIAFLDEACVVPAGSCQSFLKSLQRFDSHAHYSTGAAHSTNFTISHYAGDVTYEAAEFLIKNKDPVSTDLLLIGESCGLEMFRQMFPKGERSSSQTAQKRAVTAATQFRTQVNSLADALLQCAPHYIRCIKPNNEKRAMLFDDASVLHQIRYLGLLENVRVRRAGFAYRMPYTRFVARFKMLNSSTWPIWEGSAMEGVKTILNGMKMVEHSQYELGRTKVFVREPVSLFTLEELRTRRLDDLATLIQKVYRSWRARRYFLELRKRALGLVGINKRRRVKSFARQFFGDYAGGSDRMEVQSLMLRYRDMRILFMDQVMKVNRRYKPQRRMILLTESNIFNLSVSKFKLRRRISIDLINSIAMSRLADNYIVVRVPSEYDYVYEMERKVEFATALSEQYLATTGNELEIEFTNDITYMTKKGRERSIVFKEDSSIEDQTYFEISDKTGDEMTVYVGKMMLVADVKQELGKTQFGRDKKDVPMVQRPPLVPGISSSSSGKRKDADASSPTNIKTWARAMYDFTGADSSEVAMKAGDEMQVLEKLEDGWWKVDLNGNFGYAPSNYLQLIEASAVRVKRQPSTHNRNLPALTKT